MRERKLESRIVLAAIKRPVTITMLIIAVIVTGFLAFTRMPVQLLPGGLQFPVLFIQVPYFDPTANPKEVEDEITSKVEDALGTISGISDIYSTSNSGGAMVLIFFDGKVNMDSAYAEVYDRMERLRPDFPDGVDRFAVHKFDPNDQPVYDIGITFDEDVQSPFYLIENNIAKRLEQVDHVAKIDLSGMFQKQVRIQFDRAKLESHRINLATAFQVLSRDNLAMSVGKVTEAGSEYYVRVDGRIDSLPELNDIDLGGGIRIKDVAGYYASEDDGNEIWIPGARVVYAVGDWQDRMNGQMLVQMEIYKETNTNSVLISEEIEKVLSELEADPQLKGIHFYPFHSDGELITGSLDSLFSTCIIGAIFAVIILYLFMRKAMLTLIVTLSIPASLTMALVIMYFLGMSINLLSLMGFTLAVGMLIDNSIVVVESIFTKIERGGAKLRDAIVTGAGEVALAIFMGTSTTMVVFLPMYFFQEEGVLSKLMADYLKEIGIPICLALLASLFIALILIPLASLILLRRKRSETTTGTNEVPDDADELSKHRYISFARDVYIRLLKWSIKHRIGVALILFVFAGVAVVASESIGMTDRERSEQRRFRIYADCPDTWTWAETEDFANGIEKLFLEKETKEKLEIKYVRSTFQPGEVNLTFYLTDENEANRDQDEILDEAILMCPETAGVTFETGGWHRGGRIGGGGGNEEDESVTLQISGRDSDLVTEISDEFVRRVKLLPFVSAVDSEEEAGYQEVQLGVNRNQAKVSGVNPDVVAQILGFGLSGSRLKDFHYMGEDLPMIMEYSADYQDGFGQLFSMQIPTETGVTSLGNFAEYEVVDTHRAIFHRNRKVSMGVTVYVTEKDLLKVKDGLDKVISMFKLPSGYEISLGDRFEFIGDSPMSSTAAFMAILLVFILMGVLFESFTLPLAIMFSIPTSFLGAYIVMWVIGINIDVMFFLGIVILVGIVVNNAIVLMDKITRLRKEGYSREHAIIESGAVRFRPIIMTAATTIFGLLPMAVGGTNSGPIQYNGLGACVMGGMISATLLTLILVPVMYTVIDDARTSIMGTISKIFRRNSGPNY
ncbi:MAG: efflux RND transporter permease subunit [Planctomycetes bacterium]|nr:efflux RND transporter permease subunit [Planctomycetota bacterium]